MQCSIFGIDQYRVTTEDGPWEQKTSLFRVYSSGYKTRKPLYIYMCVITGLPCVHTVLALGIVWTAIWAEYIYVLITTMYYVFCLWLPRCHVAVWGWNFRGGLIECRKMFGTDEQEQTPSTALRHPSANHCRIWLRHISKNCQLTVFRWCLNGSKFVNRQLKLRQTFLL